jgi:hypothetical protein
LQVTGASATDVDEVLADTTSTARRVSRLYRLLFRGAGFSDDDRIRVANLTGVDDTNSWWPPSTAPSGRREPARHGVQGCRHHDSIVTNSDGTDKIVFKGSNAAFQVAAGGQRQRRVATGTRTDRRWITWCRAQRRRWPRHNGHGLHRRRKRHRPPRGGCWRPRLTSPPSPPDDHQALSSLSSLVANNSSLVAAGISVTASSTGAAVAFTSKRGELFEVLAVGDTRNSLGLGSAQFTAGTSSTSFDVSSITSAAITVSTASGTTATLGFSVGGGAYVTGSFTQGTAASVATLVSDLNTFFAGNSSLQRAGLVATTAAGGAIGISSNTGSYIRVNQSTYGAAAASASHHRRHHRHAAAATTSATTSAVANSGGARPARLRATSAAPTAGNHPVLEGLQRQSAIAGHQPPG